MAGLSPSFSTGGMPRPMRGNVGTGVSSMLKMKLGSLGNSKIGGATPKLAGVTMPKTTSIKSSSPNMSSLTLGGGIKASKAPTGPSMKSLGSTLKSMLSKIKPSAPTISAGGQNNGLNMSSSVGAPASAPSSSFFGPSNPGPGQPGLGM